MIQRAVPASGKLIVSILMAVLAFILVAAVCRIRDCTCNPRLVDTIKFRYTTSGLLAVNAITGLLYADEANAMAIAVFDAAHLDRGPLARVPTEGYVSGIAVDERANRVYVVQGFAHRIRVIEGATHIHHDIEVPDLVNAMTSIGVDAERHRLYVARVDNHDIAVFDTTTEKFLGAIDQGCCSFTNIVLAVDPPTGLLYVLNSEPSRVTVFDPDRRKIAEIAVGDSPTTIALDSPARRAYVTNGRSRFVSVIDTAPGQPRSFQVIDDIELQENPSYIAVDSAARRAYVNHNGTDLLSIVDLESNRFLGHVQIGFSPGVMAVDPVTARVFSTVDVSNVAVVQGCRAPRWPWQTVPARAPAAIATPPPSEPTAVAKHRLDVRCGRMYRIRTRCSEGPKVSETRLAHATVEAAGARLVDGGAAGQYCGAESDDPEADLAAAGFFYSVPVVEPGADVPAVWTFHATSRTFGDKPPPPDATVSQVTAPPETPWQEAWWYLSRYKTGLAPEAVAGCE